MTTHSDNTLRQSFERAMQLHRTGRLIEAEQLYVQILAAEPAQFESLNMLGTLRAQQGRTSEALDLFNAALKVKPASPGSLLNIGMLLHGEGRSEEALASFNKALAIVPGFGEALNCRGNVLQALARYQEALEAYDKAIAINALDADAHYNRGNTLRELERYDEAIASYRKALSARPRDVETLNNLGEVQLRLKCCPEALATFDAALAIREDHVAAICNRGSVLQALGRHEDALASFDRALALQPDFADALNNRGISLDALGRPEDAVASYDRAVAIQPDFAEAFLNRGNCLHEMNRQADALQSYSQALAAKPDFAKAKFAACMAQLRVLYEDEREIARQRDAYRTELTKLVHDVARTGAYADLVSGVGANQPFLLAYQGQSDRDLQALYGSYVCRIMAAQYPPAALPQPADSDEPVRVGFVCGFFYRHSVWKLPLKGWIAQLDRRRFRVFGYHTGSKEDAETKVAAGLCERFVRGPQNIDGWRREILADKPHVLIYPDVGMDPVSVQLAAQRLAPVQCLSLGHPDTSGFPTLDYFLSSDLMEPPDGQDHYTERLIRLPNISFYYDPLEVRPVTFDRSALGLRAAATVFWCGQSLFKYLPQYDEVFPRIAREAGDCQFVFIRYAKGTDVTDMFRRRLVRAFSAYGLRMEDYCTFLPRLDENEFAAAIGQCDIVLDSIGWSGNNSTIESLPHAVPIVAVEGTLMRGRHTAAILRMMGVPDTIAATVDDYVSVAARLAKDPDWRRAIKSKMAANKTHVYRDRACIAALEDFLDRVARTGQPQ